MIQITRWRPDTCDCIIEYEWDDTLPEADRVHNLKTIQRCPAHQAHQKPDAYQAVQDENRRKNKVHSLILENMPDIVEEVTNSDGSKAKRLKAGVEFGWSFDDKRKLVVDLKGATVAHKNQLKGLINSGFGTNKIDVI